ncbi:MAG: hypothetical protein QM820_16130 [Minicystis sp.]
MVRAWMAALVLVGAGFITAAGCNGSVAITAGCPVSKPELGSACDATSASCTYQDGTCTVSFSCTADHVWFASNPTCEPIPVPCEDAHDGDFCLVPGESCGDLGECGGQTTDCGDDHRWMTTYYDDFCCGAPFGCPEQLPVAGQVCDPCTDASGCGFPADCGTVYADCGDDGFWHTYLDGDCPMITDPCKMHFAEDECGADPTCRWLVPGCSQPALPQAGCFAIDECTPGGCGPFATCEQVEIDPCYKKGCDACSTGTSVCLP